MSDEQAEKFWAQYAAAALQGVIAGSDVVDVVLVRAVAKCADAMLEEHRKRWRKEEA